jgi:hypothetical protein
MMVVAIFESLPSAMSCSGFFIIRQEAHILMGLRFLAGSDGGLPPEQQFHPVISIEEGQLNSLGFFAIRLRKSH